VNSNENVLLVTGAFLCVLDEQSVADIPRFVAREIGDAGQRMGQTSLAEDVIVMALAYRAIVL